MRLLLILAGVCAVTAIVACHREEEVIEVTLESHYPNYLSYSEIRLEEYFRCHRQIPDDETASELLRSEIDLAQTDGNCFLALRKISDTEALLVCTRTQEGITSGTKFEDFGSTDPDKNPMRDDVASLVRLVVDNEKLDTTVIHFEDAGLKP